MSSDLDAIIIGSGHNSLTCACHLAKRGWKVAVYEQAAEPGGAVKTGEYTKPGFRHDWAAMNLSLFAGSPFMKEYGAELAAHGLEFVPVDKPFRPGSAASRPLVSSRRRAAEAISIMLRMLEAGSAKSRRPARISLSLRRASSASRRVATPMDAPTVRA